MNQSKSTVGTPQNGGIEMKAKTKQIVLVALALFVAGGMDPARKAMAEEAGRKRGSWNQTRHRTVKIDGVEIFYREAGPADAPTILLLHGFPTSSHMFRNLIPTLSDTFHLVAPDYPGFGNSEQPPIDKFDYTFHRLAEIVEEFTEELGLDRYSIYLMDYGAPVGFRLAAKHPERVDALIVQNGNAYEEGLREFWDPIRKYWKERTPEKAQPLTGFITPDSVKWQYTHGVRHPEVISPDNWNVDLHHLTREGNPEIQLSLFYSYGRNPPLYPEWQAYFRKHQPPTLIVWGKNDYIFPADGAHPYKRDLKNIEFHLLDTGHFALEEDDEVIAEYIRRFLIKNANLVDGRSQLKRVDRAQSQRNQHEIKQETG
ncbi:MAG: alpha/beta fold hydrolase [Kiritimatiellae bacterium]|nr:alpha/beta fold hydrolase [Kiritimatiellia bacterium]